MTLPYPLTEIFMGYVRLYWTISLLHKVSILYFMPIIIVLFVFFILNEVVGFYIGIKMPMQTLLVDDDIAQEFYDDIKN